MNTREAKDFLVQQTAEQAALEHVPFSNLERRMMSFTESGDCPEDPLTLNDAFEAEHDSDEYEVKIGKLMRHAYWRLKKENPGMARDWKQAIRQLSEEDHYILVLWEEGAVERPPYDGLKLLGTALLVILLGMPVIIGIAYISEHYGGGSTSRGPSTYSPMPLWFQRTLIGVLVGPYLYYLLFHLLLPSFMKSPPRPLTALLAFLLRRRP